MIIFRSHEVTEQVSKASKAFPYSLPNMPSVYGHMVRVTGQTSILTSPELFQIYTNEQMDLPWFFT